MKPEASYPVHNSQETDLILSQFNPIQATKCQRTCYVNLSNKMNMKYFATFIHLLQNKDFILSHIARGLNC
jgi:hypothetical protein